MLGLRIRTGRLLRLHAGKLRVRKKHYDIEVSGSESSADHERLARGSTYRCFAPGTSDDAPDGLLQNVMENVSDGAARLNL